MSLCVFVRRFTFWVTSFHTIEEDQTAVEKIISRFQRFRIVTESVYIVYVDDVNDAQPAKEEVLKTYVSEQTSA
jgi:hypothetical protein